MQRDSIKTFYEILSYMIIPTYNFVAFLVQKIYKTTSDESCTCRAANEILEKE